MEPSESFSLKALSFLKSVNKTQIEKNIGDKQVDFPLRCVIVPVNVIPNQWLQQYPFAQFDIITNSYSKSKN